MSQKVIDNKTIRLANVIHKLPGLRHEISYRHSVGITAQQLALSRYTILEKTRHRTQLAARNIA
jgi:hypothetical protein